MIQFRTQLWSHSSICFRGEVETLRHFSYGWLVFRLDFVRQTTHCKHTPRNLKGEVFFDRIFNIHSNCFLVFGQNGAALCIFFVDGSALVFLPIAYFRSKVKYERLLRQRVFFDVYIFHPVPSYNLCNVIVVSCARLHERKLDN